MDQRKGVPLLCLSSTLKFWILSIISDRSQRKLDGMGGGNPGKPSYQKLSGSLCLVCWRGTSTIHYVPSSPPALMLRKSKTCSPAGVHFCLSFLHSLLAVDESESTCVNLDFSFLIEANHLSMEMVLPNISIVILHGTLLPLADSECLAMNLASKESWFICGTDGSSSVKSTRTTDSACTFTGPLWCLFISLEYIS